MPYTADPALDPERDRQVDPSWASGRRQRLPTIWSEGTRRTHAHLTRAVGHRGTGHNLLTREPASQESRLPLAEVTAAHAAMSASFDAGMGCASSGLITSSSCRTTPGATDVAEAVMALTVRSGPTGTA